MCDPSWARDSGKIVLWRVCELLGIPLAPGQKNVHMRPSNPFLGVVTDLSRVTQGFATLRPKPSRVASLLAVMQGAIEAGALSRRDIVTIIGKIEYLMFSSTGLRLGRASTSLPARMGT